MFPRIPHFWSADHLYSVAAKIGPIRPQSLKFSPEELERITIRKSTGEPMEQEEEILMTPLTRPGGREEPEFCRVERMDLLESPPAASFNPASGGGWLQLAMASKMMAFARPERSSNDSSPDTGRYLANPPWRGKRFLVFGSAFGGYNFKAETVV